MARVALLVSLLLLVAVPAAAQDATPPPAETPPVAADANAAAPLLASPGTPAPEDPIATASAPPVDVPPADAVPDVVATPAADELPPGTVRIGDVVFHPRLQARFRYEDRVDPYGNGVELLDQRFVTTRLRVGIDASWSIARAVIQVQDFRNFGSLPGQDDGGTFALHQGFAEVGDGGMYVRLGRQEIDWGDQRMLGALDWVMGARSFDALRLGGQFGGVDVDVFGAMLRPKGSFTVEDELGEVRRVAAEGDYLAGARVALRPIEPLVVEPYLLYRHDGPIEAAPGRDRDIASPGIRLDLRRAPFFSTVEGTVQFGRAGGDDHFAYAASADIGATLGDTFEPKVSGGFSVASGATEDGDVDEFENFFPTNHKFYGYADLFGLRNIVDGHVRIQAQPLSSLSLELAGFWFALKEASGRWSNAGGGTLGQSFEQGSRSLGGEIDLQAVWKAARGVKVLGGYAVFLPASGAERLGHSDPTHWSYVMLALETP